MERTVALRSMVDGVSDSEVLGDGRGVDVERRNEAIQMVGMARSIVSWRGGMARLEAARAVGTSGGVTVDESLQNMTNRGVRRMRKFEIGWDIP
jgi:hypothetical protein